MHPMNKQINVLSLPLITSNGNYSQREGKQRHDNKDTQIKGVVQSKKKLQKIGYLLQNTRIYKYQIYIQLITLVNYFLFFFQQLDYDLILIDIQIWKQFLMLSKQKIGFTTLAILACLFLLHYSFPFNFSGRENQLQVADNVPNSIQFTFKSISSILRTTFTQVNTINDTVYAGDKVGSVTIWTYDSKKKKLDYQDVSRQISAALPQQNRVIHLESQTEGVVLLTADGKLTSYFVNAQSKITGNVSIQIQQKIGWFTLIRGSKKIDNTENPILIGGINDIKNQMCIYELKQSIVRPNPVKKIQCNRTSTGIAYEHIAFDPLNNLISVGDQSKAIVFQYSVIDSKSTFTYLTQANLPKVQAKGFQSIFANGTLLAINDLWISSIFIDVTVPSARVISAQRTEKLLKSGETNHVTAFYDSKLKKSLAIANSKGKIQGYSVVNNKLTYLNDSKAIGGTNGFTLKDQSLLFAVDQSELSMFKVGDQQQKDYLTLEDKYSLQSGNHFKPVKAMTSWNNSIFVSVSQGGSGNVRLWNYSASTFTLRLADQKTITYFSLLKSGIVDFLSVLIVPPPVKQQNANIPYHIAVAGSDPFSLYIMPITAQDKLGTHFKSKDSHYNNITSIFLSSDKKKLITTSMDSTAKIWELSANHDQLEDNTTTIITKDGPISAAIQSKSSNYYAFAHCSTLVSKLANISIWKQDAKHGLIKLAENVPGEAHESNITNLILTQDEKYLISLSQSGQMRLWRLQNWTMVDLMASLALGVFDAVIKSTETSKVILESQKFFSMYYFDQNGFILLGRQSKIFNAVVNSSLVDGNTWFSGDEDGSIRIYTYQV